MWRKTKLENIKVTDEGIQFKFDTNSEAEDFYKECQEKATDAILEEDKVTLVISAAQTN